MQVLLFHQFWPFSLLSPLQIQKKKIFALLEIVLFF